MDFEYGLKPEPAHERTDRESFADVSMSRSSGLELIPKGAPSAEALNMDIDQLLADMLMQPGGFEDWQVRMVMWTMAIQNAFEKDNYAKGLPGFRTATYGFFDPETEMDGFGVIAYVAPSLDGPPRGEFHWVNVDQESFRIMVRPAEWTLHAPPNPTMGTATCWAQSRKPRLKNKPAMLTAKHVVGNRTIGSNVPLTSGRGTLLDLAPEGIDAALVRVSQSIWPGSPNPLQCQRFIAQWTDVDVYTASGSFSTKITEVNSGRGSLDPNIPLRVFLANPGQSGDSGALVLDTSGNGIGLYMGEMTTQANVQEGFCQHLAQVEDSMAVDLFL
ncbi:MAG TPA: hypothetical protein VHB45_13605 [Alloacidobacterium sp.]|nr:hypothetical protein [Alloacidobacterium sp.]